MDNIDEKEDVALLLLDKKSFQDFYFLFYLFIFPSL